MTVSTFVENTPTLIKAHARPRRLLLEEELIRQESDGRPVSAVGLARATARRNPRLRLPGLSSRELWTQRNQFTHKQLPLSDYDLILGKHEQRSTNHASSEKSKSPPRSCSKHAFTTRWRRCVPHFR